MKIKQIIILIIAILGIVFTSCKKDEIEPTPEPTVIYKTITIEATCLDDNAYMRVTCEDISYNQRMYFTSQRTVRLIAEFPIDSKISIHSTDDANDTYIEIYNDKDERVNQANMGDGWIEYYIQQNLLVLKP